MDSITELQRRLEKLEALGGHKPQWVYANDPAWVGTANLPLTSTSWDGDAHSTEAKTLIDLSAVFGVPAGVKAVLVEMAICDSGSAANDCYLILSPNDTAGSGPTCRCSGVANDKYVNTGRVIPCDANGDIYEQILASGASTLDAVLQVWGYMLA